MLVYSSAKTEERLLYEVGIQLCIHLMVLSSLERFVRIEFSYRGQEDCFNQDRRRRHLGTDPELINEEDLTEFIVIIYFCHAF